MFGNNPQQGCTSNVNMKKQFLQEILIKEDGKLKQHPAHALQNLKVPFIVLQLSNLA